MIENITTFRHRLDESSRSELEKDFSHAPSCSRSLLLRQEIREITIIPTDSFASQLVTPYAFYLVCDECKVALRQRGLRY